MNSIFNDGFGTMQMPGMDYADRHVRDIAWTNPLSAEEERELHKNDSALTLDIPKESIYRAKCTHRNPATKKFDLFPNDDGTVTCRRCGARFTMVKEDIKVIERITNSMIDILQTIKTAYVDMTPEVVKTYFVMIPFLRLAPDMYKNAISTLSAVTREFGNYGVMDNNQNNGNYFDLLNRASGAAGMNSTLYEDPRTVSPYGSAQTQGMGYGDYRQDTRPLWGEENPFQSYTPDRNTTASAMSGDGGTVKVSKTFNL